MNIKVVNWHIYNNSINRIIFSYSMWLEAYLGNGKVIKSNVLDVRTKMSNRNQSPGKEK